MDYIYAKLYYGIIFLGNQKKKMSLHNNVAMVLAVNRISALFNIFF